MQVEREQFGQLKEQLELARLELDQVRSESERRRKELQSQVAELSSDLRRAEAENDGKDAEIARLKVESEADLKALRQRHEADLKAQAQSFARERQTEKANRERTSAEIEESLKSLERLRDENSKLREEMAGLRGLVRGDDELSARLKTLELARAAAQERESHLEQELKQRERDLKAERSRNEKLSTRLTAEVEELKTVNPIKALLEVKEKEIERTRLEFERAASGSKVSLKLQERLEHLFDDRDQLSGRVVELESSIRDQIRRISLET